MTKGSKIYSLKPEHEAMFPKWRDKWIANAMRTGLLTPEERHLVTEAIRGLYGSAGLKEPRIIFVPSPFVGAFASGFSAGIWYLRATETMTRNATRDATNAATHAATNAATRDATDAATRAATDAATDAATYAATDAATHAATRDATRDATNAATRNATDAATDDATRAATDDATRAATDAAAGAAINDATRDATKKWYAFGGCEINDIIELASQFGPTNFLLQCASNHSNMLNGGNQWSGWVSYLSFFRHVVRLDLDYSKWDRYETAAIAGPRYMHKEFCLVSEPPLELHVDDQNRPHCETGPFCRWADGSRLYSIHGVLLPGWIVECPDLITLDKIREESNVEIKRLMREKYGEAQYLKDIGAKVIDVDTISVEQTPDALSIVRALMEDDEGRRFLVGSDGSTHRTYYMEVDARVQSCREAHAFLSGFSEDRIIAQS